MTPQPNNSHSRSSQSAAPATSATATKGFYGVLTQLVRQQKRQRNHGRG